MNVADEVLYLLTKDDDTGEENEALTSDENSLVFSKLPIGCESRKGFVCSRPMREADEPEVLNRTRT